MVRDELEREMFEAGPYISSDVALRFLENHLVSLWNLLANPSRHVLCCGVEVKEFVEISMVKSLRDKFFQMRKVDYHTVSVQCFGATVDGDDAVMPVQTLALALIIEVQLMGIRYFDAFRYEVHSQKICGGRFGYFTALPVCLLPAPCLFCT